MSTTERLEAAVAEAEREVEEAAAEVERLMDAAMDIDVSTTGRDGRPQPFVWPAEQRNILR